MWGKSELQVPEICSRRLVYCEVVEVRSNYMKSCDDLEIPLVMIRLGVTVLKKTEYLLGVFGGNEGGRGSMI